jgi:hypothetical protein
VKRLLDISTSRREAFTHQSHSQRVITKLQPTCLGSTTSLRLGVASFFLPGVFPDLGAATVVGSLFGFGAFLAQVWTRQTEREESKAEDEYRQALSEIEQRRRRVAKKLLREIRRLERRCANGEHIRRPPVGPATSDARLG